MEVGLKKREEKNEEKREGYNGVEWREESD